MNPKFETFGSKVNQAGSIAELLKLESQEAKSDLFQKLDEIVGQLLVRILQGEQIVNITQDHLKVNTVKIQIYHDLDRDFLNETFCLEHQQARGAWFLPEHDNLQVGKINLPWMFKTYNRFANGMALEERGKVWLNSSADAVFIWAVLEPLSDILFLPFELRGHLAGTLSREETSEQWNEIDIFYQTLGFQVTQELAVMRWGGGWHKLRAAEQLEAKHRLLKSLALQVKPEMGQRYRAFRVQALVNGYYKKANREGQVKRKRALTKPIVPNLAGFFGGDWLAFLNYLGEKPHPEEQIMTALPETRPFIGGVNRVAEIAALQGVSIDEIERIAGAYWQQSTGQSPIEKRVEVLRQYWSVFDNIHAHQSPEMKSLWGLLEDYRCFSFEEGYSSSSSPRDYQQQLYQTFLPEQLQDEIVNLWGYVMLAKFPDRIVSELFPHQLMAETFGTALKFWHGCALTAWFICEGCYSRTDIAGMQHYYRRELATLETFQTPIDLTMFDELLEAETKLGSIIQIEIPNSRDYQRREGFENLRDIITRHRRIWAERFLSSYLHTRWESEILEAGRVHNLLIHEGNGKAPTLKKFAKSAVTATNHWFGGNISSLYGAIREKSPIQPERFKLMPEHKFEFAQAVYQALSESAVAELVDINGGMRYLKIELANLSLNYIQIEEASGREPNIDELGIKNLKYYREKADFNIEKIYDAYSTIILEVREIFSTIIKR